MNTFKLLAIACITIFIVSCKASQPTAPNGGAASSLLEVHNILDSTESQFLTFANQTNGDPWKAIGLTTTWLQTQPTVQFAYADEDSITITIVLKSGLRTAFHFEQVDDNGYSIYRGGGGREPANTSYPVLATHSKNTIKNKKVLIFATDTKTLLLEPQIKRTLDIINNSGLGLEVTVLRNKQCNFSTVSTFQDYGLVIIDGHGEKNGFYLGLPFDWSAIPSTEDAIKAAVNTQWGNGTSDKLQSGQLQITATVQANPFQINWALTVIPKENKTLLFNANYLYLLPPMPNTVVFGNMCYSGWTNPAIPIYRNGVDTVDIIKPIGKAFIDKNLISYYGYARTNGYASTVTDVFAQQMEEAFVKRLVDKGDSTGIVHLKQDRSEYWDMQADSEYFVQRGKHLKYMLYFKHFGNDDYSYLKCGDPLVDSRDGQVYPTVCIDTQVWMAKNLNFKATDGLCYDEEDSNCTTFGMLYNWHTVMQNAPSSSSSPSRVQGVCPKGWHVPSEAEWKQAIDFLGGGATAANAMQSSLYWKYPTNNPTINSSGFSIMPGGFRTESEYNPARNSEVFSSIFSTGEFWSATEINDSLASNVSLSNAQGVAKITQRSSSFMIPYKSAMASCRCLKD